MAIEKARIEDCTYNNDDASRCKLPMARYKLCKYHYYHANSSFKWPTQEDKNKMIDLYNSGMSSIEVSKETGYSKACVLRNLNNAGIVRRIIRDVNDNSYKSTIQKYRNSSRYKNMRKKAIIQSGGRCLWCNSGDSLQIDHIKPTSKFVELFFDESNIRVLCMDCHKKTKTYGAKVRMTA